MYLEWHKLAILRHAQVLMLLVRWAKIARSKSAQSSWGVIGGLIVGEVLLIWIDLMRNQKQSCMKSTFTGATGHISTKEILHCVEYRQKLNIEKSWKICILFNDNLSWNKNFMQIQIYRQSTTLFFNVKSYALK